MSLNNAVPGVQIISPDPLSLPSADTPLSVRFTDALLYMPAGQNVTLTGQYDSTAHRLILSADFASNPVPFIGDQLKLTTIRIEIAVTGTDSDPALDTTAASPVTVTGSLYWEHNIIGRLGIADDRLPFALSYAYTGSGNNGFRLTLDATPSTPIAVSRVFAAIEGGQLAVEVLPDEQAIVLSAQGDAKLTANGGFITQARGFLTQIFGADTVAALTDPAPFVFRQKFRLNDVALPGDMIDLPSFTFFPRWTDDSTPALDTPDGVEVAPGQSQFSFTLPDTSLDLPELNLSLRNTTLRFPEIPALASFDLLGHLSFQSDGGGAGWSFTFEPLTGGTLPLPDILQFFLAQLTWLQGALPDLEDIPDLLQLSMDELDWFRQFEALLAGQDADSLDPAFVSSFPALFESILDGAAAIPGAPDLWRLFRLAFRALRDASDQLFPLMLDVLLARAGSAWDEFVVLIEVTLADLNPDQINVLLDSLLLRVGPNLDAFFAATINLGAAQLETNFAAFIRLWTHTLAAAVRILDPAPIADVLLDLMKNSSGTLVQFRSLTDIPAFSLAGLDGIVGPIIRTRTDVLLCSLGLQALLVGVDDLDDLLEFADTGALVGHIFQPVLDFFKLVVWPGFPPLTAPSVLNLFAALMTNASGDRDSEFLILQIGRNFPLGILFALTGIIASAGRSATSGFDEPSAWTSLLFKDIEADPDLKTKRLPAPGSGTRYLIFSDIHRDQQSDDRGRVTFGSIDHFSVHRQLYLEIINWADDAGYTVIEAGDGEELWFIRDFETFNGPVEMLNNIISMHQPLYDKLADMYRRGRYWRLFGNHDSYIRDQAVFDVIASQFAFPNEQTGEPFDLYDYVIIPGVKTMADGAIGEMLGTVASGDPNAIKQIFLDRIGLDSEPYTQRKPLIVTHGHQWDFWNCDPNNLIGKLLANSVGVPADMLTDPFVDTAGLNMAGNVLFNFQELLAGLPVFNNFPAYAPAVTFAHKIQHLPDSDRLLIDDIFYLETLTALSAWLTMPLTTQIDGQARTWAQTLAGLPGTIGDIPAHLFNQIMVGHTHYPQARPYLDLEGLLGPVADLLDPVRDALADLMFGIRPSLNFIQPAYYNSGTAGWMEGVIWAIEINEHGEARLIYWTQDTRLDRPQQMDWQLPRMDETMRNALNARKAEVEQYFQDMPALFGAAVRESLQNAGNIAALPFSLLLDNADALLATSVSTQVREFSFDGLSDVTDGDFLAHTQAQVGQVGQWLVKVFLGLLHDKTDSSSPSRTFTLSIDLPDEIDAALNQIRPVVAGLTLPGMATLTDSLADALACLWLLGNRSAAILNRMRAPDVSQMLETRYPVVWLVFGLLALLPLDSDTDQPLSVNVTLVDNTLTLAVTVDPV